MSTSTNTLPANTLPARTLAASPLRALHIDDPMEPVLDPTRGFTALALRFIRDGRDIPFLKQAALQTAVLVPFAVYLFLPGRFAWWLSVPYWLLTFAVFLAPYTLMLHNTSHRKLFRAEWSFMNSYIPWVLGPLMGQSPGTYYAHHLGMHHAENNLEPDLSSTLPYQRDSIRGFLHYYFHFIAFGSIDLVRYFRRTKRPKLERMVIVGELAWLALAIAGSVISWRATVVVLVVPLFFIRFLMLAGNWGQHAFVAEDDPNNCYRNSITCINCGYNKRAWNDGYHIGHHISATRHWTEMPGDLLKTQQAYVDERAIVFQGIDFFIVWALLMGKRYDVLARRFVPLDEREWTEAEIIALLKARTAKFSVPAVSRS